MIATITTIAQDATAVLGTVSLLATALSHLPLPARAAEFFARIGLATAKFSVNKRPGTP
jgi:hypothetical protein